MPKPIDTVLRAQRALSTIHAKAAELWTLARDQDVIVVPTPEIDQRFCELSRSLVELHASLDLLLDEECARHEPQLDPTDPLAMNTSRWQPRVVKGGNDA